MVFSSLIILKKFNMVSILILAWSLADAIRFYYYSFENPSYISKWLRYSAFIILYPIGFCMEFLTIQNAYDTLKAKNSIKHERIYDWLEIIFYFYPKISIPGIFFFLFIKIRIFNLVLSYGKAEK